MRGKEDTTRIIQGGRASNLPRSPREALFHVYRALQEKGYDPIRQIAYYLLTGEPAYITAHENARSIMAKLERDEIIEELVRFYLTEQHSKP